MLSQVSVLSVCLWSISGRFENGFFEDDEDETDGEDFRIRKWDEDYEDNPYDILRVMLNYIDNDAGTALHLATKVRFTNVVNL